MRPRGLITDWGGVLTTPLNDSIGKWLATERIDIPHYRELMRTWVTQAYAASGTTNPIHGLERGDLHPEEFERLLAAQLRTLDGLPVAAVGLLQRMFVEFRPVEPMYQALRQAKAAGIRTGVLSNSWGNTYPREAWAEMFDVVVISGEVGMRKPDAEIFRHAVELLGLEPPECVFIDDIAHNIEAAERLGMVGVHHVDVDGTLARLEELFGVSLR